MSIDDHAATEPDIGVATRQERHAIARVLAQAEIDAPLFDAPDRSEDRLTRFFVAYLKTHPRLEFQIQVARDAEGVPVGVALWRHNDVGRDSAVFGQLPYLTRAAITLGPVTLIRALRVQKQFERYRPLEPHWYLPYVAVARRARRSAVGTALLQYHLDHLDRTVQFAYLEARSHEQVQFFERFGFVPGGRIPGLKEQTYTGMFRTPQRRGR